MSRTSFGILLLLGCSLVLGFACGELFYRLFLKTIPPLAVSSFSTSAAHFAYLMYGGVLGLIFFGWSMLAALLARFFVNAPAS